jgi:hypothetical protein
LVWQRDVKLTYDTGTASHKPRWSVGGLVDVQDGIATPVIRSFDRLGSDIGSVSFSVPGASKILLNDYSRDSDGTIFLGGNAFDQEGRNAGFLASISPSNESVKVVRTAPYTPYHLALAPDGTVWTAGIEMDNFVEPAANRDKDVIRHFDRSGKLLASFIPRSTLESPNSVIYGYLAATKDRLGWYVGLEFGPSEYVEISRDGLVNRFPSIQLTNNERVTGMAVTDNAGTFVTTHDDTLNSSKLLTYDKTRGSWLPVELPTNLRTHHWASLYGGDGNSLVFMGANRFVISFYTCSH